MPSINLGNNLVYRDGNIHRLSGRPGDSASSGNIIRAASPEQIARFGSAGRGAGEGTRFINPEDFVRSGASGASGSTPQLAGQEFRTGEQRRAESELAAQLGVDRLQDVKPPKAPELVKMEKPSLVAGQDEFLTTTGKLLGETPEAAVTEAAPAVQVTEAPTLAAPRGTAASVAGQEAKMEAATLAAPTFQIDPDDIEGTVSAESLAEAQTEELDQRATASFQLKQLFEGEGNFTTLFARPIREATDRMLARGLGSSSMAAAAIIQSTIESGIPIAREDANKFATIQLQNLTHKQATALANASVFANMDQTNVGVRLNSNIELSRAFLEIDTQNLRQEQQEEVLNQAAINQFLLSDQAADNAMEQLNVTTEAQTDQFFSQLGVQVRENNANRITAVEQFNANQANTISVFNARQKDLRERFNSELQTQIEASNAQHRRRITLLDNANQMLVNEFNAREVNAINTRDYQQQYLNYRDTASRIFASVEGNENRAVQLASSELAASASGGRNRSSSGSILPSLIGAAGSIFAGLCPIAQEVYGTETTEWIKFRHWMYHDSPKWFKKLYIEHSVSISKFISNKPLLKQGIKYFMDRQVRKVNWNV